MVTSEMLGRLFTKASGEMLDIVWTAMNRHGLTADTRVAARFCAQVGHESINLEHTEEIGHGVINGKKMKYAPYFGRGLIQLTWLANYQAYQKASGLPVVTHPELLTDPEPAADSAAWWYTQHGLDKLTNFDRISICINGTAITPKSLADRRSWYRRACAAFGCACDLP
jgi:putative chitinase